MQNSLHDILAYILLRSEQILKRKGLSKYRITKIVYLCDWCYACACGRQITDIHWFFDNYGPFVWDVYNTLIKDSSLFELSVILTPYENEITTFSLKNMAYAPNITRDVQDCLEYVLEHVVNLKNQEFTNLVYATYPIRTSRRYTSLNLVDKANEYRRIKRHEESN